jgi:hypothetical protein
MDLLERLAASQRRHQALYATITASHPSLLNGVVWCRHCQKSRTVDPARCLREGWPKCCEATMGLDKPAGAKP